MNPTVVPVLFQARDQMSATLAKMQGNAARFANSTAEKFKKAGQSAFAMGRKAAVVGAVVATPLVLMAKSAVEFEDRMSDVGKTTGMQGVELRRFGDDLLAMSTKTRTSIDDLATIAEVGGQLGVPRKEMIKFTAAANQFSIALGADFSGGVEEAVASISKMKTLFKDTRALDISQAITRSGSAINELGAVGNGTSANITDFGLRMGALPDALKDTATNTLALGAYLEEMGINSQIAAGGMSNLLLVAGQNLPMFAKQMGVSASAAKEMLAQNPSKFAQEFASSFKGMAPEKLASKLQELKLGSQETIKVIGALSSDQVDAATGMNRLATLQGISNKAFAENNSLKSEAAKKEATAAAQMAKFRNNLKAMSITLGNALLPMINDLVEAVTPVIQGIANWVKNNRWLAGTIMKVAVGVAGMSFAVSGASFAVGGFQKAMVLMKTPLGMAVVAIGALAVAYTTLEQYTRRASTAEELASEVRSRALDKTLDQRLEVRKLFDEMRRLKEGSDGYKNALAKIEAMQPGITEKYNLQKKAVNQLTAAEKDLTQSIMARAMEEVRAEMIKEKMRAAIQRKEKGTTWLDELSAFGASVNATNLNAANSIGLTDAKMKKTQFTATDVMNADINKSLLEASRLEDQSKAANPEAAKQKSFFENALNINITGLPDGSNATMDGKQVSTKSGLMPKLSSTR